MLGDLKLPDELKSLNDEQIRILACEIRQEIIRAVEKNGGHLSSNLGVVELAIALHKSFESPKDAIIWDVSHQCYAHKLLTGRYQKFYSIRTSNGLSGFTKRSESLHDFFDVGHASTSISSALGLAIARCLQGQQGKVIAVIGDGALTGGLAYEALLNAGEENVIIVLNDNQMAINKTTGAMSQYLSRLRISPRYQSFRNRVDWIICRIPFFGKKLAKLVFALKRMSKSVFRKWNLFAELGLEYVGPIDGHDIKTMEDVFNHVKNLKRPVVVHVMTQKGRGFRFAEENPALFHGVSPFTIKDGIVEKIKTSTFTEAFSSSLIEFAKNDSNIVAITAAMRQGTGLEAFSKKFPKHFFDVGICEEHAVTFSAAMALTGLKPIVAIYSTFFQRTIDQVIHDVALQDAHVIFALDRSGAVPDDGSTHQGIFDIALLRPIPNLKILSPATACEMKNALKWALNANYPVALRYPKSRCCEEFDSSDSDFVEGQGVFVSQTSCAKILLVSTGGILADVISASEILTRKNIKTDVYNLRFLKPVDEEYFANIIKSYDYIAFIEDGVKNGGIGEYLQTISSKFSIKSVICAFPDSFPINGKRQDLLNRAEISALHIVKKVENLINSSLTSKSAASFGELHGKF